MDINRIGAQVFGLSEKIKDSASKTKEAWKTEAQIMELQNELTDAYRILGYAYYESRKNGAGSGESGFRAKSKNLIAEIDEKTRLVASLSEAKAKMAGHHCTQCGKEVPEGSMFCNNCGAPYREQTQNG